MMCSFLFCPSRLHVVLTTLIMLMFCGAHRPSPAFVYAFVIPTTTTTTTTYARDRTRLFGLSEWRKGVAAATGRTMGSAAADQQPAAAGAAQPQPLLLLPFVPTDALTLGQSTTIVLKEGRYYDLFQDCIDEYHSIMGMVIMGDDGLWETVMLCDISDFEVDAGYRGKVTVSVTLRAVGRARLVELVQMKPVMVGLCLEVVDDVDGSGDTLIGSTTASVDEWAEEEDLLGDIESTVQSLGMESRYREAFELAERTIVEGSTVGDDVMDDKTRLRMAATSWAVFGTCIDGSCSSDGTITSCLQEAMATTSIVSRLKLGQKALLEMKFSGSDVENVSADPGGDMVGFG